MFFDIKNWNNKVSSKEFQRDKKKVLKLFNLKNNKKLLDEFSFLKQDSKILKKKILEVNKEFSDFKKIVLIGTGGSSLGSKAILDAGLNERIVFIENIDPQYILKKINRIKERRILLIIASKSGETSEVISLYQVIINYFHSAFN